MDSAEKILYDDPTQKISRLQGQIQRLSGLRQAATQELSERTRERDRLVRHLRTLEAHLQEEGA